MLARCASAFFATVLLAACSPPSPGRSESFAPGRAADEPFAAGTTVEETLLRHHELPDPAVTIWWRVTGPAMAWNHKNVHQLSPTVNVYRAGRVAELAVRPDERIASFVVDTKTGSMTLDAFLNSDASATMGLVVLHRGEIVFERYPRMQPHEKPIWWSVTKVFVSTLVAILEDRGLVDTSRPIETYVPELAGTAFEGVSVRDVLDMASGVDCADGDYSDLQSCYMRFEASLGDGERDESSPDNPYDYLGSLRVGRWAEPGTGYDYSGVNTFVLGWLVEKVTGMPFQDALSREIWTRVGMESDASIYAGRNGIPLTSGGLLANVRDVARFGVLFTPSWSLVTAAPIISARHLEILESGGRPELLRNARDGQGVVAKDVKYNVYQWDRVFTNGDLYKGGWAGQGLLVNPQRNLVAAYVGYAKDDAGSEADLLPILRAVLDGVHGSGDR